MKKLAFCIVGVALGGCVQVVSVQPLYTKADIIFKEELLATWLFDPNQPEAAVEFSRLDEAAARNLREVWGDESRKLYHLNTVEDNGSKGSFIASLVKLGDRLFIDTVPDRFPSGEQDMAETKFAHNAFFILPVHTFIRVDSIGEQLAIRVMLDRPFQELVRAEPNAVQYQMIDGRPVLTASTKELQEFVTRFADDERLFTPAMTLTRKAK
jgi:hypothetical protein